MDGVLAFATFYNTGCIREMKDMPTACDMKVWPYAELRADDPFNLVISMEKNAPKSFQTDVDFINFVFATHPKSQERLESDSRSAVIVTPNYAQDRYRVLTDLIFGAA